MLQEFYFLIKVNAEIGFGDISNEFIVILFTFTSVFASEHVLFVLFLNRGGVVCLCRWFVTVKFGINLLK